MAPIGATMFRASTNFRRGGRLTMRISIRGPSGRSAGVHAGTRKRHLLVGSAIRETAGNHYFQHLLGYRPRNLRVEVMER
jgi:hypothetical protein